MIAGNPQAIKEGGWRQGSILPNELVEVLRTEALVNEFDSNAVALVVTQDCDLVSLSYVSEPFFEIVILNPVESIDGNLTFGKNPRKLQFCLQPDNTAFEVSIHSRHSIDRKWLESYKPHPEHSTPMAVLRVLRDWIARRYTRSAFPDNFNERCSKVKPKIEACLKKRGSNLSGIFVRLNSWDELGDEDDYQVIVVATHPVALQEDELIDLYEFLDDVVENFDSCEGIQVIAHDLVSEAVFSLDDLRNSLKWECDHLSLRDEGPGIIAPSL